MQGNRREEPVSYTWGKDSTNTTNDMKPMPPWAHLALSVILLVILALPR